MDQPSGQRSNVHHQGGSWREMGNSYQRRDGTGRASGGYSRDNDRQGNQWNNRGNFGGQYNRGNDSRGNQWITRGNYRQENRQHHQEYRPQRGGFDNPPINQKPNAQQQEDRAEAQSLDNFNDKPAPADLFLDILTKEEREALLNEKMEEIRKKNDALKKRHELLQLAKGKKENDVKSTMCIEKEEFPNSSDFVYDLEDSTNSSCTVREDSLDEEIITINEPENSASAVDYLMEKDVVAVHVEASKDGLRRITCVMEDKSFIFEVENNPDLMNSGKVAEFFNWTPATKGPTKVFNGLDSKTCAVFFDKHEIILDGTRIFDLKIAYDMMREYGLGDMTKLKKTGFSPDCIPVDTDNVTAVCLTYIKAYQYFSHEIIKEMKDYKKELFTMVTADICKEDLKELRDRKKKEIKAADFNKSKSNKLKKMKDFSFPPLPLQSNKTEINFESERKLKIIPNSDSSSSHSSTFAEYLLKECNSPAINLQAASTHPSLNSTLQQEFNETRQMARQCATQKSQEEQCQVIVVVKQESVDFPDGRRYTCRSTVVPDPVIVEGKSTTTQTESDKCKDVGVQCEIIDWNKYQKMIELAEVLLK